MSLELTFTQFQDTQYQWLLERNLDTTTATQTEKFFEESGEACEALAILQSDYTTDHEKDAALELVDVIIVSLGLLAEMHQDAGTMIADKYQTNCIKYELTEVLKLQASGMSPVESMQEMKRRWSYEI